MATAVQITANQSNAARSTGPRTAEGKHTVSKNATTHGLTSTRFVLSTEEQSDYDAMFARLLEIYKVADPQLRELVEQVAQAKWRLARCRRTEAAFFDRCIRELTEADPSLSPDEAMAAIFTDSSYMAKMRLFLRYQSAIERAYAKACSILDDTLLARIDANTEQLRREGLAADMARLTSNGFVSQPSPSGASINRPDPAMSLPDA
jgi:hypothetical protein